jgi:hypothetical protein
MRRADFLFVIGYDGDTALVHGQQRRRYGKLTTQQLLDRGLYKAAFCSAAHAESATEMELVRAEIERVTRRPCSLNDVSKLFGVFGVPAEIKRVIAT